MILVVRIDNRTAKIRILAGASKDSRNLVDCPSPPGHNDFTSGIDIPGLNWEIG